MNKAGAHTHVFEPVISLTNASLAAGSCILPPDSLMITGFCEELASYEGQWHPIEAGETGRFIYKMDGFLEPLAWWDVTKLLSAADWGFGFEKAALSPWRLSTGETPPSGRMWVMSCGGAWDYRILTITPFTVDAASCEAGHEPISPTMCAPCPPGSFSGTISTEKCDLCELTTFAPDSGSSSCQDCPSPLTSLPGKCVLIPSFALVNSNTRFARPPFRSRRLNSRRRVLRQRRDSLLTRRREHRRVILRQLPLR